MKEEAFRKRKSVTEISALSHAEVKASSDGLGWHGIRLEVGANLGCNAEDVMVDGHYVFFNLGESTLHFETRVECNWVTGSQPPQTFWINPEGRPFSMRHGADYYWASAIIDGTFLDSVVGRHYEIWPASSAVDTVLSHLMQSLVARLHDHEDHSSELDAELVRAFVLTLAKRHGAPAAELPAKGGIAPYQLKSLVAWLEQHIDVSLTIDEMAVRVGLSVAHFSREFKRSTGLTPWGYFVQLRLDKARRLLEAGEPIGSTAKKCGFSDHSHLSRLFKQRFGLSPLAFIKAGPHGGGMLEPR